jgi:hypothetical protein
VVTPRRGREGIPGTEGPIRTGSGRLLHSKAGLPKPIRRSLSYDIISRGGHHRMYRVVKPAVLRAGPDLASKRVERLRAGEMLRILESRENSEGVSRVRCSRGWLSLTDASGNPLIEEERESEGVQFPFKVRRPSELLQQCDPWSDAVVSHSAPPLPPAPTCASVPRSATADLATRCPCRPHSARC